MILSLLFLSPPFDLLLCEPNRQPKDSFKDFFDLYVLLKGSFRNCIVSFLSPSCRNNPCSAPPPPFVPVSPPEALPPSPLKSTTSFSRAVVVALFVDGELATIVSSVSGIIEVLIPILAVVLGGRAAMGEEGGSMIAPANGPY